MKPSRLIWLLYGLFLCRIVQAQEVSQLSTKNPGEVSY